MAKLKGWKFPIEVNKTTGRIMTVEDEDNVKQSIKIILQTEPYERKQLHSFGSSLNQFVFQGVSPILIRKVEEEVTRSLRRWEENIDNLNVKVERAQEGDNSTLMTSITYDSAITGREETIVKETNLLDGEKI